MRAGVAPLAVGLVVIAAGDARAQGSSPTDATAVVVGGPIAVEGQRGLDFGDVLPGAAIDLPYTDPLAARWRIEGVPGAEVELEFLLPSLLVAGAQSFPIHFDPTHAGHFTFNVPGLATTFDPNTVTSANLRIIFGGVLFVWLGGRIVVPAAQAGGLYTASVTLVVSYASS